MKVNPISYKMVCGFSQFEPFFTLHRYEGICVEERPGFFPATLYFPYFPVASRIFPSRPVFSRGVPCFPVFVKVVKTYVNSFQMYIIISLQQIRSFHLHKGAQICVFVLWNRDFFGKVGGIKLR